MLIVFSCIKEIMHNSLFSAANLQKKNETRKYYDKIASILLEKAF